MTSQRRGLTVVAAAATLVGIPAILVTGAVLRHGGVAAAYGSARELRLDLLRHGIVCNAPRDVSLHPSTLTCDGRGPAPVTITVYPTERARRAVPADPTSVVGANWRVDVPAAGSLVHDVAAALHGHAGP